ncbi:SDR family NAD(P)-dependent oxidoreductase [Nitriliruptor alkaliphilus]|uniref:SDR family NAD(P)-dependent oxidoreductase n=1 Tax=Nitriliruptor alkaliphilus TaxID=427918 RepID=UPI001B8049EF|nr:SDR family oxidoreductase [Nitriliruptor alkaliphilus]
MITQAGSNFGRTSAEAHGREGAKLYLQDWEERADRLEKLAVGLRSEGVEVEWGVHDLTTGAEAGKMTQTIMDRYGQIDVLVNTAMEGGHGVFLDLREDEWDLSVARGLKSFFLTCQYVGEEMALKGYGKIINFTSIVADLGSGGAVGWGTVRGGVNALTYAVAHALGEYGVRVVALARGAMESTPYTEEARDERLLRLPFKRLGLEEDLVGPLVFLATSESDWIHGSVVYCDGGYAHAAATDAEHRATSFPLDRRGTRVLEVPRERDWIDTDVP